MAMPGRALRDRPSSRLLAPGDPVLLDPECTWMVPLSLKECGWPQKVEAERQEGQDQFVRLENGRLYHARRFRRA